MANFKERTTEEILAKIREYRGKTLDMFGTRVGDWIEFLAFDDAKEFLKPDATEADWNTQGAPFARDAETIKDKMKDYMPFAWGKANDERGLSANRSLHHMEAWLWMIGEEAAMAALFAEYIDYGKPQLRAICEKFGWAWEGWNDGGPIHDVELPWNPAAPEPPASDPSPRKPWYGSGAQPWDAILASGWGPAFAAANCVKYLRRTKDPVHSLESARWYYARLYEFAAKEAFVSDPWSVALARLEHLLSQEELQKIRGVA